MTRVKDAFRTQRIVRMKAEGKEIQEIAQEIGVSRQTVSAYLKSPEAKALTEELQAGLLDTLNNALKKANQLIKEGNVKIITEVLSYGKTVLAQTPMATEERTALPTADRQALLESLRDNIQYEAGEGGK